MARTKLTVNQIHARHNAYNEAIDHLCNNDAFDSAVEREQAQVLADQLVKLRSNFEAKYADRI